MRLELAYSLTPFHLLQALCIAGDKPALTVLTPNAERYARLLAHLGSVTFRPIEESKPMLAELSRAPEPFDFSYAVPWNRTALRLEKLALARGGHVHLLEDGTANYRPNDRARDWQFYLHWLAYRLIDGTHYCDHILTKRPHPERTTFHSIDAKRSILGARGQQIDIQRLPPLLDPADAHFRHLEKYRGLPIFLDTNDCEGGWYPFELKVALLRELLAAVPTLYFPHPRQSMRISDNLPFLIDLSGQTHDWNELAIRYLKPSRVTSVISTAVLTLRRVFGMEFENILLHDVFLERTRHPAFALDPLLRAALTDV